LGKTFAVLRFDNVVGSNFHWKPENTDKKKFIVIGNPPFIEYGLREPKINSLIQSWILRTSSQ
jgi:hypothetical protein